MADTGSVLARLQAALSTYDPTWDVTPGSATYKIMEAVAQEIANASNNSTLQTYSFDVNTKSGSELDNFCNIFGVYRRQGKRATGTVTFSSNSLATNIYYIPIGSQVSVPIGPNYTSAIYFTTTAPAIIGVGESSVDVPVVASLPGSFSNVPANSISTIVNSIVGVTTVTNASAMSGGTDPENDQQLRNRWQSSAFNNTTGTVGKYNLTALQDPYVTLVNTIGQQSFYDENLQVNATVSGGSSGATFLLVAYSGMINPVTLTTYTGTTVVASGGFAGSVTGSGLATGLTALVSGVAPNLGITVSVTPSGNTLSGNQLNISFNAPSPYQLTIGSGSALPGSSVIANGVTTISGTSYWNWIQSNNPDLGVSGTLSNLYNIPNVSGYLFPQGNELIGSNVNSYNGVIYQNNVDYIYPTSPTPQLYVVIANGSNNPDMFIGNNIEMISEYCSAASRSLTLASGNFIDIFINGTTAASATEQTVYNPSFTLSSGNAISYLNSSNYIFANGSSAASNAFGGSTGDVYIPLNQQPAINFPSQVSVASSGVADSVYLYNTVTNSGLEYPIALNPYNNITFTGTLISGATASGTNFIPVSGANSFLYPGLALSSSVATSGSPYYISSVTSSGVYLNNNITGTYSGTTNVTITGKALVYPIYDVTDNANSPLQTTGLVFRTTGAPNGWPNYLPGSMAWVTYTHDYNNDVTDVSTLVNQSKPVGANTLVHQATFVNLVVNVTAVFSTSFSQATIQSNAYNQLSSYFSGSSTFLGTVSFSDIATQLLKINGINNIRINSVNVVALDGTVIGTYTKDFGLASNQLPSLYGINWTLRGSSNF